MEQRIIRALCSCPLFRGMTEYEVAKAMTTNQWQTKTAKAKDIYALAGGECHNVDIVVSGSMRVTMGASSGKRMLLLRLHSGDIVAPPYIYAKGYCLPVVIEAESDVELLRMTTTTFDNMINNNATVRNNFIVILSDMGALLASKLRFTAMLTIKEKICQLLHNEAKWQQTCCIRLNESRQQLANIFGVQKFSIVRVLRELEACGAIKVKGREIEILSL